MGGGGGDGQSTSTSQPIIPPELRGLYAYLGQTAPGVIQQVVGQAGPAALGGSQPMRVPGMMPHEEQVYQQTFGSFNPQGLLPSQAFSMGALTNLAGDLGPLGPGGLTGIQRGMRDRLRESLDMPIGRDRYTRRATRTFMNQMLPEVQQQLAAQGLGQGAIGEASAMAMQRFGTEMMGQEIERRMQQTQMLAGLGDTQAQQRLAQEAAQTQQAQMLGGMGAQQAAQLGMLQQLSTLPRDIQSQRAQAQYQELLNQRNLLAQFMLGPLGAIITPATGQSTIQQTSGGGK